MLRRSGGHCIPRSRVSPTLIAHCRGTDYQSRTNIFTRSCCTAFIAPKFQDSFPVLMPAQSRTHPHHHPMTPLLQTLPLTYNLMHFYRTRRNTLMSIVTIGQSLRKTLPSDEVHVFLEMTPTLKQRSLSTFTFSCNTTFVRYP